MRLILASFEQAVACALAISIAMVIMQFTETFHPPGGATALLAVTIQPTLFGANFLFILIPTLSGACIILVVALIINNIPSKRTYPCFWW
jgi:CBS-domain-containing membrane protein